jgi:hypothetical protein
MVARQLGIPHGTARSRLHYALDALRQQLQDNALREQLQDNVLREQRQDPARPQPHPARPQSRAAA